EVVNVLGGRVSSRSRIAEQHPLARASERESSGKAAGSSSYNDDVIQHVGSPSWLVHVPFRTWVTRAASSFAGMAAANVVAQGRQRDLAETREQQCLRILKGSIERCVDRLFDQASGGLRSISHGEQRGGAE